jgi:hypothetical protein
MTFYIRLAFTSGLALRIKGAAYFTKSQRPETDNTFRPPAKAAAAGTAPTTTDWVPYTPEPVDCDRFSVIPGPNNTLQEVWISRERDMKGYFREHR